MKVKVVIFDWDGTLIDSVDHIADSLHQAAAELGYPEHASLCWSVYRLIVSLTKLNLRFLLNIFNRFSLLLNTPPAKLKVSFP